MSVSTAIKAIINDIPKGYIFDSHLIINKLIKEYTDDYLDFASSITTSSMKTLSVHGMIGQEIASLENSGVITRLDKMSWSENIHNKVSECTAWEKR